MLGQSIERCAADVKALDGQMAGARGQLGLRPDYCGTNASNRLLLANAGHGRFFLLLLLLLIGNRFLFLGVFWALVPHGESSSLRICKAVNHWPG